MLISVTTTRNLFQLAKAIAYTTSYRLVDVLEYLAFESPNLYWCAVAPEYLPSPRRVRRQLSARVRLSFRLFLHHLVIGKVGLQLEGSANHWFQRVEQLARGLIVEVSEHRIRVPLG